MKRRGKYALGNKLAMISIAALCDVCALLSRAEAQNVPMQPPYAFRPDASPQIIGNPGIWFGPTAYPPAALSARQQGRVVARLQIDEKGAPQQCEVVTRSGSEALDNATCPIAMERLRFTPGRDEKGRVIAGHYTLSVHWVLPAVADAGAATAK